MAIIFLDCYMAINLVYKYWKFNVGYHKAHLLRLLLMNAKKKKKNEKIALLAIDVYKNYIDLPCIFNCKKIHVF